MVVMFSTYQVDITDFMIWLGMIWREMSVNNVNECKIKP